MGDHPTARTMMAPLFYNFMIDIAYGFKGRVFKGARTNIPVYALVYICILTGSTSILAMEGIEIQDMLQAIEQHACWQGMPTNIFINNSTQLKALAQAEFSIRDLNCQLYHKRGIKVHVSNVKCHEERGRVERRIRTIRDILECTGVRTSIQWETVLQDSFNRWRSPLCQRETIICHEPRLWNVFCQ